jgi:hypothetical protein
MTRILVAAALAGAAVVAAIALLLVRWPGDLGSYGNWVGATQRLGEPLAVGSITIENRSSRALVIDAVRLASPDGVSFLGALVAPSSSVAVERRWPPAGHERDAHAAGYRMGPHARVQLIVGAAAVVGGDSSYKGVEIDYHRSFAGVPVRLRDHVGLNVTLCVRHADRGPCSPPAPSD